MSDEPEECYEEEQQCTVTQLKEKIFEISGFIPTNFEKDFVAIQQFLYQIAAVDKKNPEEPFVFVLNNYGGSADTCWAILDTMRMLSSPISTIARYAGSAAALILVAGTKGYRYIFPHGRILVHGAASHGDVCPGHTGKGSLSFYYHSSPFKCPALRETHGYNKDIAELLYKNTGGKIVKAVNGWEKMSKAVQRTRGMQRLLESHPGRVFNAAEAIQYGIVDGVLSQEKFAEIFQTYPSEDAEEAKAQPKKSKKKKNPSASSGRA